MFSLLNLISGFLETGAVIFTLHNFGMRAAFVSAFLYQIGNLIPIPVRISKGITFLFAVVSFILMIAGILFPVCGMIAVPFLSVSLQSVRAVMKTDVNKVQKRVFRILGFLLGFFFQPVIGAICAIITLLALFPARWCYAKAGFVLPKFGKLQVMMVLTQMQYFVYCYAVIIIVCRFGGALCAAGLFFAGWLAYVFAPKLYKGMKNYRWLFIFGHLLLVVLMLTMFFIPSLLIKVSLWILTGFGGTTEFCIGKLEKQYNEYNEQKHDCAENIGHFLGVIVCLVSFVLSGSLHLMFLLSALFAGCAAVIMMTMKKGGVSE